MNKLINLKELEKLDFSFYLEVVKKSRNDFSKCAENKTMKINISKVLLMDSIKRSKTGVSNSE